MPRGTYGINGPLDDRRRKIRELALEVGTQRAIAENLRRKLHLAEARAAKAEALLSAVPVKERELIIMVRPSPEQHDFEESYRRTTGREPSPVGDRPATPGEIKAALARYWNSTREARSDQLAAPG